MHAQPMWAEVVGLPT